MNAPMDVDSDRVDAIVKGIMKKTRRRSSRELASSAAKGDGPLPRPEPKQVRFSKVSGHVGHPLPCRSSF